MEHRYDDFMKLSQALNQLQADPNARLSYELFSDALVWSDELPVAADREKYGLTVPCWRGVLRYRTTIILGAPDERYRQSWDKAKTLCPNWPGFLPERQEPTSDRIKYYEKRSAELLREWQDLDVRYEAQRAKAKGGSAAAPIANGANGELTGTDDGQAVPQEDFHR